MTGKAKRIRHDRRDFLRRMAAVGGVATAAAASGSVAATAVGAAPPDSAEKSSGASGYRVTPHIRTYYEKARF